MDPSPEISLVTDKIPCGIGLFGEKCPLTYRENAFGHYVTVQRQ